MAIGKILPIKREGSGNAFLNSLLKYNRTRFPGVGVYVTPFQSANGRYRVAFDDEDPELNRIRSKKERDFERQRRKEIRERLERLTGLDLRATSDYWDYTKSQGSGDRSHASMVKLIDGENIFDLSDPYNEITFSWLKVHPIVAPSYDAVLKGVNSFVQFYVYDEEEEIRKEYNRKTIINKAIMKLNNLTPDSRKKVAKLLGLPVVDESSDDYVYNQLDTLIKEVEFKSGKYIGLSTIDMFERFADLDIDVLNTRALIEDAITYNVYRERPDGIYEGNNRIGSNKEEVALKLLDPGNQSDLIALHEKVKAKKLQVIGG